jgi:hypothetical protein
MPFFSNSAKVSAEISIDSTIAYKSSFGLSSISSEIYPAFPVTAAVNISAYASLLKALI